MVVKIVFKHSISHVIDNDVIIAADHTAMEYIGGEGDDEIYGGAQGEIIDGGAGHDILTGGDGADTFRMSGEDELLELPPPEESPAASATAYAAAAITTAPATKPQSTPSSPDV